VVSRPILLATLTKKRLLRINNEIKTKKLNLFQIPLKISQPKFNLIKKKNIEKDPEIYLERRFLQIHSFFLSILSKKRRSFEKNEEEKKINPEFYCVDGDFWKFFAL